MNRQRYREWFEATGLDDVRENIRAGVYSGEILKHAEAWIVEVDINARQAKRAESAFWLSLAAFGVAIGAAILSLLSMFS